MPDILFGGARGGGKSDAILGDWLRHAAGSGGHARGIILRRTTDELDEVIRRSKEIFTDLGATWRIGIRTWFFPGGSTLKMRWLDRDEDAHRYQGHSYTYVAIDEAGTWPDPTPIDKLRATLRSPHRIPCIMRLTANPGGVGHQWLKERYVAPAPPKTPFYDEERRQWRVFIPSKITDNPALLGADPTYIDRLYSSGPPWLVRAWLEGDWDASAGDAFFMEAALLVDGAPVQPPPNCDYVAATIDTAHKVGDKRDGTACVFWAYDPYRPHNLTILDWDIFQIEGAMLVNWLPTVFERLEEFAKLCRARYGSLGASIEDTNAGSVLLQQAKGNGWPVSEINHSLTALGKTGRALNVSEHVYSGKVKISEYAYTKVSAYKSQTRNHFLSQVTGFRIGIDNKDDDLVDCFTCGVAEAMGNSKAMASGRR